MSPTYVELDGQRFEVPSDFDPEQRRQIKNLAEQIDEQISDEFFEGQIVIDLPVSDDKVLAALAGFCRKVGEGFAVGYARSNEEGREDVIEFRVAFPE